MLYTELCCFFEVCMYTICDANRDPLCGMRDDLSWFVESATNRVADFSVGLIVDLVVDQDAVVDAMEVWLCCY